MSQAFEQEILMLLPGLISGIPSGLLGIASYVLTALAIYTVSRRRGLRKPWLAWIPVVNVWLLGSLSDQYSYVVKGEIRSRRKWLVTLKLVMSGLILAMAVIAVSMIGSLVFSFGRNYPSGEMILSRVMGPALSMAGLALPLAGIAIAYAVIYYIALYDVYKSLDPDNAVLFLVLSILFRVTEPFFLFFNRDKDKGMPPRRQQPVYEAAAEPACEQPPYQPPQQPQEPFWENEEEDKSYL
ncbi:MAG: hypothetical protein IKA47_11285 [Oscillospiraceae bacterium]|nr:hypothetical protein [Oscillospiraceae bacterium]